MAEQTEIEFPDRLEVGKTYRAWGPTDDSKMGPAQECVILAVDEDLKVYKTKGARQVSDTIAFGCEFMWLPVD